jgi:hypothetical protein
MLELVISGGQTGADMAGLRAAREVGIKTGGYAPRGWKTERGQRRELLEEFGLEECHSEGYKARTWRNVEEADCTIRIASDFNSRGERCTRNAIEHFRRPFQDILFAELHPRYADRLAAWIVQGNTNILNVAGNTESHCPGMEKAAMIFLIAVFKRVKQLEAGAA